MPARRPAVVALLTVLAVGVLSDRTLSPVAVADSLPSSLSDEAFWGLVSDFSEPNGFFRSDNFLSNELAYQSVIPELTATLPAGGVYLGVGPEQNFTYLVALKPKLAFIVDIRRGNLHEHLLYKALIEMSADRAEFLSRLFSRKRPANVSAASPVDTLMSAYQGVDPSQALFDENLQAVTDRLTKAHHFALSAEDVRGIAYVYTAFFEAGPDLNYTFVSGAPNGGRRGGFAGFGGFGGNFPTYADLMVETDGQGQQRGYLASEDNFRVLADLEKKNAVVPVVGDFAGPKALRSVGRYVKDHGATVTAFYTSNVEMYLFQSADWQKFYANVATLPVTPASTFIRSVSGRGRGFQSRNAFPGARSLTRLSTIAGIVTGVEAGTVRSYADLIALSR